MIRCFFIAVVLWTISTAGFAQPSSHERAAIRLIHKQKWQKAESHLRRSLGKQPVNALARYLLSTLFFAPENPKHNTDSAYHHVLAAIEDFGLESARSRERMMRWDVDSLALLRQRDRVDSAAFEAVRVCGTEVAFIDFLRDHPFAPQRSEAIALRNKAAFENAVKINTYGSYYEFLGKYPNAVEAPRARKAYEKLVYESATADGRLSSFEQFLREHPDSPYRAEVERNIFELSTASGDPAAFVDYLSNYPECRYARIARNVLFYLVPPDFGDGQHLNDSLRHVLRLQESYLVPFLEEGRFGLMDKDGRSVVPPIIGDLDDSYRCGNITEEILVMADSIIGRNGQVIFLGNTREIDDIGAGFLTVTADDGKYVIHKSGLVAHRNVDDARVVGNRLLAVERGGRWSLFGLTGRPLGNAPWEGFRVHENVVLLRRNDHWHATAIDQLFSDGQSNHEAAGPFDDMQALPDGRLLVSYDGKKGIIGQDLGTIIPFSEDDINPSFFGYTTTSGEGKTLYRHDGLRVGAFDDLMVHDPWVLAMKDSLWYVVDMANGRVLEPGHESPAFEGPFLITHFNDTATVHFGPQHLERFAGTLHPTFVPGKDSTAFLVVDDGEERTVYDIGGIPLFTTGADDIQHTGGRIFTVVRRGKKGLMRADGKLLLPMEYDAIGDVRGQMVSLLRNMKFGIWNVTTGQLIPPQYDKNIRRYHDALLVAYKDGGYGFVDWNNQPKSDFVFDEVTYWNDTSAWVRRGPYWALYAMERDSVVTDRIKSIRMVRDDSEERLAIVHAADGYGVMSSTAGTVIPPTFSDLVNVGSGEQPLYFTEKHVAEASVFVVIYYDRNGKFLRRAIYDDADEYEKIYCRDH